MGNLRLIWEEKNFNQTFTELNFCENFELDESSLKFGIVYPPIKINNRMCEYINFTNILFLDGVINFSPSICIVKLDNSIELNVSILTPIPKMTPSRIIRSENKFIYTHIFHLNKSIPTYLTSISSNFCEIRQKIEKLMIDGSSLEERRLFLGVLEEEDKLPELVDVDTFFDSNFTVKDLKLIEIIFINWDEEFKLVYKGKFHAIKDVPNSPKYFLLEAVKLLTEDPEGPLAQQYRRIITICYNGGIPTHLIDQVKIPLHTKEDEIVTSNDFQRIFIDFQKFEQFSDCIDHLQYPLANLISQLYKSSSEATLRTLFLDTVLGSLFCNWMSSGNDYNCIQPTNIKLISEWSIKNIFPKSDLRIVDFVATFQPCGLTELPIFLVEIGKNSFDTCYEHKDYTKLLSMMSVSCISLARELQLRGKRAELARTYGVWIGGLEIHYCVAHAVVTSEVDDNNYELHEIHANLSFFPQWKFDILADEKDCESAEESYSCKLDELEMLLESDRKSFIVPEVIDNKYETFNLEDEEEYEDNDANEEMESKKFKVDSESEMDYLFQGHINISALKKLKLFIECAKRRVELIQSDNKTNQDDGNRNFKKPNLNTIIPKSVSSSSLQTPLKSRVSTIGNIFEASKKIDFLTTQKITGNYKFFTISKKSVRELKIYKKLVVYQTVFPKLFGAEIDKYDPERVNFKFEKLIPMLDPRDGSISSLIHLNNFFNSFFGAMVFSLHCLYSLHILHKYVRIIHSDISPWNILYSPLDNSWKIIDFDQSLDLEASLITKRIGGTKGYIAPESQEFQIFNEASDVFSLGQVILNIIYPVLLQQFVDVESMEGDFDSDKMHSNEEIQFYKDIKTIKKHFYKFEKLILSMACAKVEKRPAVLDVLEKIFLILKGFTAFDGFDSSLLSSSIFVSIEILLIKYSAEVKELEKFETEISNVSIEKKEKLRDDDCGIKKFKSLNNLKKDGIIINSKNINQGNTKNL